MVMNVVLKEDQFKVGELYSIHFKSGTRRFVGRFDSIGNQTIMSRKYFKFVVVLLPSSRYTDSFLSVGDVTWATLHHCDIYEL